jgi:4-amino-4-deoxychorismate lyase
LRIQNILVEQNQWTPDFVQGLEAIAISNSAIEIIPFSNILSSQGRRFLNPTHWALEQLRSYFITHSNCDR